jgi:hypothetical protein
MDYGPFVTWLTRRMTSIDPPRDRINPMRSEESRLRNIAATQARHRKRYATDEEYRERIKADALARYYANREAVLERLRLKRQAGAARGLACNADRARGGISLAGEIHHLQ